MSYAKFEVGPWPYDVEVDWLNPPVEQEWYFSFMMEQTIDGWTAKVTTVTDADGFVWPLGMASGLLGNDQLARIELEQADSYVVAKNDYEEK